MKKWKGFAVAALGFGVSGLSFCLDRQFSLAAGMAGIALTYTALAYRAKKTGL
ncbi:hypothetical protein [Massilia sp. H6]|uniref:hypothetical protein n=1 Tax=Massilia sp. H6 TaxID=2970464 RepID=UPI0021680F16|nr:hypothetical protein [Massilia sp. H6]UVW29589.1 hypothetical protein NRS07_05520 [Massilia sp. H6]